MIDFQKYQPHPSLAIYIDSYFVIRTGMYNKKSKEIIGSFLNFSNHPQGTIDMMFSLHGQGIQLTTNQNDGQNLSDIFLMAQQEGKFDIKFMPDSYIFGIVFYSESFSKFLKLPLSEITNGGLLLKDELDKKYLELYDKLKNHSNSNDMVVTVNKFIVGELARFEHTFGKFDKLIRYIRATNGQMSIEQLSSLSNMSTRSLQRKMKEVTGVSPKSYSRTVRFKYAINLIILQQEVDWHDILFECGYYDQAHFIKEFKFHTGYTPSEFIKNGGDTLSFFFSKE